MMLATEVHSDGIAVLRLDNEQRRNALSIAMRDAISDTLDQWATDDGVRVVVITGTGTAFCAGFGRRIDAVEAHRLGLLNAIVDADRLVDEAIATARVMAEAPQAALEATKRYLTSSAGVTFREAFEVEHDRVFDEFLLGAFGPGPGA